MAFDLATLGGMLPKMHQKQIARVINREAPLLHYLPKLLVAGKDITWQVSTAGVQTFAYTEGAAVVSANFSEDVESLASLGFGRRRSPFSVTDELRDAAVGSIGAADPMRDPLMLQFMRHVQALTKKVGQDIFTGSGARNVIGLASGLVAAGGTYAGLTQGSSAGQLPDWQSSIVPAQGVPIASALHDAMSLRAERMSGTVSVIVMHPKTAAAFSKAQQGVIQYNTDGRSKGKRNAGLNIGFDLYSLEFAGVPILSDVNCPESKIYGLDLDPEAIFLAVQQKEVPKDTAAFWINTAEDSSMADESEIPGLLCYVKALGSTGVSSEQYDCAIGGTQLVVKNPARHFCVDLSVAPPPP